MRAITAIAMLVLAPAAVAAQPCTSDAREVVEAIYEQVLERSETGTEGEQMIAQLAGGSTSVRDLVRAVGKSPEHKQRFLPGDDADDRLRAVSYLYVHLLGRKPDANGMRTHTAMLRDEGVDAVVDSLVNSPEYERAFGEHRVPGTSIRYCAAGDDGASAVDPGNIRFRGMDRNRNGRIERAEWNGSEQSFNVHDWNNDGVLSGDEVRPGARRAARAAAADVDFDPFTPVTWTETDFAQLDRNDDNRITSNEWYYSAEPFRRADRNRDGALTLDEFTDTTFDDDRDDRFENLDVNRSGRIERGEWHGSLDAFQWLDRNRDDVLSRAEVAGDTTGRFDAFASLDTDADGRLELDEWRWSRRSFNGYDRNGDGILSRAEFAAGGGTPRAGR